MSELIGFIFIVCLGTIFHFAYKLSNKNRFVAYFTSVNESTWEHIKLAIGPNLLWTIIEIFFINNNNFYLAKALSLITMILLIPILYYSYTKLFKVNIGFINIFIFIISIAFGQYISYLILNLKSSSFITNYVSLIAIIIISIYYVTHTYTPLKNELFKDPITNKYGLECEKRE